MKIFDWLRELVLSLMLCRHFGTDDIVLIATAGVDTMAACGVLDTYYKLSKLERIRWVWDHKLIVSPFYRRRQARGNRKI